MINLLPPDLKESYRFAGRNRFLRKWLFAFGFALVGLALISVGGIWYLQQNAKNYEKQNDSTQLALAAQKQSTTEKQVQEISDNVKLVVKVLSKEILFSKLLKQLATIIPSNATLSGLSINQLQGALDISANTTDYAAASQLQVNLADPNNKIFSKADIVNITCTSDTSGSTQDTIKSKYPCTVTVRALFNANNPYLFIGNQKGIQ